MTSEAEPRSLLLSAAAEFGSNSFLTRLSRRVATVHTTLCIGVDPDPTALPVGLSADLVGVERFAQLILDACLDWAAAVKINVAFFEAFGSAGGAALERVRARIPDDVPFIADAKRADISTSAARQATALYDMLDAHAVTASPYLGGEAIAPLLERADRFVYVLCRTSNPGAAELQNLVVEGQPLYLHVARRASGWAAGRANVGLVVGATAAAELAAIRAVAPELPFLVPGLGAQGGELATVMSAGPANAGPAAAVDGGALLVNVSRGIAAAALGSADPEAALAAAAAGWAARLQC